MRGLFVTASRSERGGFFVFLGRLTPLPQFRGNLRERGARSLSNAPPGFRPPLGAQPRAGVCGRRVGATGGGRTGGGGWARPGGGRTGGRGRYARTRGRGRQRRARRAVFGGKKRRQPGGVCRVFPFWAGRSFRAAGAKKAGFARFLSVVHKPGARGLCSKSGCFLGPGER